MSSLESDVAAGMTEGGLNYTEAKLLTLIKKLKAGKLGFIQDEETIDLVKEQLKSGEWALYKNHIKDPELCVLVQMGITLRRLDEKGLHEKRNNLRDKILTKYKLRGLHIAQFVQEDVLRETLGDLAKYATSSAELIATVEQLLYNIQKQTQFVQHTDKVTDVLRQINTKLDAHSPLTFIVFTKETAIRLAKQICEKLKKQRNDYLVEPQESDCRYLIILTKKKTDLVVSSQ